MSRIREMRADHRRILRLALGVSLAMAFSQALNWPMSFIAPLISAMMLTLPLPAPTLRQSIIFIGALIGSLCVGLLILPFMEFAPATGILLMGLVLFGSFLFTARGGSPLLGTFLTVGMTVLAAIGSLSVDVYLIIVQELARGAIIGFLFVWLAHFLLPDPPPTGAAPAAPPAASSSR